MSGPVLGLFFLGLFVPFANSTGAFWGTISSLIFSSWIFTGFYLFDINYPEKSFPESECNNLTFYSKKISTNTR